MFSVADQLLRFLLTVALLALGGCIPCQFQVQPQITGTVVDAATHQLLTGSTVALYREAHVGPTTRSRLEASAKMVLATDDQGNFFFPEQRRWGVYILLADYFPTDWALVVQRRGYAPQYVELPGVVYDEKSHRLLWRDRYEPQCIPLTTDANKGEKKGT